MPRPNFRERGYTSRWDTARRAFLAEHPRCTRCGSPATVVHHRKPHRGNPTLMWDRGNWEPVCKPCHDGPCQHEDRHGYSNAIGDDGLPTDPRHPFNTGA